MKMILVEADPAGLARVRDLGDVMDAAFGPVPGFYPFSSPLCGPLHDPSRTYNEDGTKRGPTGPF